MALETGTYINSLVPANPASTDGLAQADDHIRLLKATIKATLPNVTGAITATHTQINSLVSGAVVPSGGIIMWSGHTSTIPSGWYLCNGSNGTPDLTNRFVMGAGSSNELTTGGTNSKALVLANMPWHRHTFSDSATTSSAGNHSHSGSTNTTGAHSHSSGWYGPRGATGSFVGFATNDPNYGNVNTGSAGNHSHTISTNTTGNHTHTLSVSGNTNYQGSTTAFDNRPAYMALAYIMKS
jgi:microcystin-dependent protein